MKLTPLIYPVSTACNLQCDYCFHRHKRQQAHALMTSQTVACFISQFMECTPDHLETEIIWHGGEPLLWGLSRFKQAVEICASNASTSVQLTHCIQSNGTLINKQWAQFFKDHNFKVGLSIDGPLNFHDAFRRDRHNGGTFTRVMKAADCLHSAEIDFGMVIVVHARNVESPRDILRMIHNLGVKKVQISPCMEVGHQEPKDNYSITSHQFARFMCEMYDLWASMSDGTLSIGYLEDIVNTVLGDECDNCLLCDGCHNFLVLDWNGDIKPCEDLFGKSVIFGNIHQTHLSNILASDQYRIFYQLISDRKHTTCSSCEWFELCKGGCPYQWPSYEAGKTALCVANQIIFRHITSSLKKAYATAP